METLIAASSQNLAAQNLTKVDDPLPSYFLQNESVQQL